MRRFARPRAIIGFALLSAWLTGGIIASQRASTAMSTAATRFLDGLSAEQRKQAAFPLESEERLRWHFIPTNTFPRKGVSIKEMTEPQRTRAHELLRSALSERGHMTARAIMDLETTLKAIEDAAGGGRNVRDPELYFFTIFGTPSDKGVWGWRVEGHHMSLHFTVARGTAVASTPTFFGANPAEVRVDGPKKGLRILGAEEDAARALLGALDDAQRTTAVINDVAPNDIVTSNKVDIQPLSPPGVTAAAMTQPQRDLLVKLIETYTSRMAPDIAADRMQKIRRGGMDKIAFAWAGETERGKKHYYRVQGPTFLIEYDNTQNDGNHIHLVWRDFNGDFGRDLLREHVQSVAH
jgi:hypothetical protein